MTSTTIDLNMAIFLAAVCNQTYMQFENPDGLFVVPQGYRVVGSFSAAPFQSTPELFGFIIESDDQIVVAFRGTSTPADWVTDAMATQEYFNCVPNSGWTHHGFTNMYKSARQQIMTLLNGLSQAKTIYITGHSLGGGLATLCTTDVAAHYSFAGICLYTFGSPRVGNPEYASGMPGSVTESWRIHNKYDLVTQLPPIMLKLPKSETIYYYMHVKKGYELQFEKGSVSANHAIGNYQEALVALDPAAADYMCKQYVGLC